MGKKGSDSKPRSVCPKKDTDPRVIDFMNRQGNFSDAMLYLIEQEILKNGIRDLSMCVPSKRNILPPLEEWTPSIDVPTSIPVESSIKESVRPIDSIQTMANKQASIEEKEVSTIKVPSCYDE